MIEFFLHACQGLRQGASADPELLAQVRVLLQQRRAQMEAEFPSQLGRLQASFLEAAAAFEEALDALELAFVEDTPELSGWIATRAQDADETLRFVEQQVLEHSQMLSEEEP